MAASYGSTTAALTGGGRPRRTWVLMGQYHLGKSIWSRRLGEIQTPHTKCEASRRSACKQQRLSSQRDFTQDPL
jgi:hypothetical protein